MQEEKEKRELPGALKTLAGVAIVFLLLAAVYVFYQAMQVLFPPNTYETALLATVEDTVDAEGVLLFNESYVAGDGTLGYLVADGERVSAGTAVAEVYSDASQAGLRQQLTQINDQIDLLQKSQNTTSAQMESLRKDRSAALYDLMDALDASDYEDTDAQTEDYLLAQNKLWIITGEVSTFSDQIAALVQQASNVQAQLGSPTQITAPQTGYFIRSASSGRLNAGMEDILALGAADLKAYIESSPEIKLDGCAGKIVSGFTWYYAGICSAKQGEKLLGSDGKPRKTSVEIRFPGQAETPLKATVQEVNIDIPMEEISNAWPSTSFQSLRPLVRGHQRRRAAAEPGQCAGHRGAEHRPAGAAGGGPLPQRGRLRGRGSGRELHPRRLRQVRQPGPFLQDRPRGRPAPPGAGWRLSHRFAQRNGRFDQSGSPL